MYYCWTVFRMYDKRFNGLVKVMIWRYYHEDIKRHVELSDDGEQVMCHETYGRSMVEIIYVVMYDGDPIIWSKDIFPKARQPIPKLCQIGGSPLRFTKSTNGFSYISLARDIFVNYYIKYIQSIGPCRSPITVLDRSDRSLLMSIDW